ncbi:MAG TPA: hypothetical protein VK629_06000 [Steroidobacteraceae bacterium]|nr:hypothetical protein [Steroidobacteraceae bacterium]
MTARDATIEGFVDRIEVTLRAGGASELDVATVRQLLLHRHELETIERARRVQQLEARLADRDPGERRDIICTQLGMSKTHFYELRKIPVTDRTGER